MPTVGLNTLCIIRGARRTGRTPYRIHVWHHNKVKVAIARTTILGGSMLIRDYVKSFLKGHVVINANQRGFGVLRLYFLWRVRILGGRATKKGGTTSCGVKQRWRILHA